MLRNSASRHKDAAMCDAHHVEASAKACRVLLWDALKNAHLPQQLHVPERQYPIPSSRAEACESEQSLMQISHALKVDFLELWQGVICCRFGVAQGGSPHSIELLVALSIPAELLGNSSLQRDSHWSLPYRPQSNAEGRRELRSRLSSLDLWRTRHINGRFPKVPV